MLVNILFNILFNIRKSKNKWIWYILNQHYLFVTIYGILFTLSLVFQWSISSDLLSLINIIWLEVKLCVFQTQSLEKRYWHYLLEFICGPCLYVIQYFGCVCFLAHIIALISKKNDYKIKQEIISFFCIILPHYWIYIYIYIYIWCIIFMLFTVAVC